MGSHRADSRASRGRQPVAPSTPSTSGSTSASTSSSPRGRTGSTQPGKRAARRPDRHERRASATDETTQLRRVEAPVQPPVVPVVRAVEPPPLASAKRPAANGKRCAPRKALFRGLPSAPILLGVAALAVSVGGAVSAADPALVGAGADTPSAKVLQASAINGASGIATTALPGSRGPVVSRDSRRDALAGAAGDDVQAEAEAQVKQLATARAEVAKKIDRHAAVLRLNQWQLPVASYHLTARFGDYGLWSSFHTGLDFAAPSGTPIYAVANGTISSAQYDGSYGNKTVETLEDGTELWYCHQTSFVVSAGDTVHAGELIGYIGSTGHVTGPHLHLEVRPGGGDPVDPYEALVVHGVTP